MNLLGRIDQFAGIKQENKIRAGLERTAFVFLVIMVLSAPHSIAATQIAWLTGMSVWFVSLFFRPRPRFVSTPLDLPLWAFLGWAVVAAVFSYQPLISLGKLSGAGLFLIFYFVVNNLRNLRSVRLLAFGLILSCMVNVLWMPVERIIGRGVEIHGVSTESPLNKALLRDGDALLKANGKKVESPDELVSAIEQTDISKVEFYRPDFNFTVDVERSNLLAGGSSMEKLGIASWKKSRNWRSQGFYGHYATYAEVLQLIASLTFGLFIGGILSGKTNERIREGDPDAGNDGRSESRFPKTQASAIRILLPVCLAGMLLALLLTATRASQAGFLVSAAAVVLLSGSRKMIVILALAAVPAAVGGLFYLQQAREVGFFDRSDDSTSYRETVYREGVELWLDNPRHFFLGIGMDTVKDREFVSKWHLFDNGRLAVSHFHSTPIQLLVERGIFGLIFWLILFIAYLRTLWKGLFAAGNGTWRKALSGSADSDMKFRQGLLLGCFGGAVGFFTSGLVHYNLGDSEVAMIFYLLMGLSVYVCLDGKDNLASEEPAIAKDGK